MLSLWLSILLLYAGSGIAESHYDANNYKAQSAALDNTVAYNQLSEILSPGERVDCMKGIFPKKDECNQLGCIFDKNFYEDPFVPICYFPRKSGYIVANETENIVTLEPYKNVTNFYGENISPIQFTSSKIGESTLNIQIGSKGRFKPPLDFPKDSVSTQETFLVEKSSETGVFSFKIKRQSTGATIWDTSIGGMMFADQYIQIASFLNSSEIFGIGENIQPTLRHALNAYYTWAMFATADTPDSIPDFFTGEANPKNLYGVYPFFMALESDSKAHGVLFLNSNPQEITLGPAPHVVYRTIGGMIDIYFFAGPTPEDVIRQYLAIVGKPMLPPFWALGYQIGRRGFKDTTEIDKIINATYMARIPLDVIHIDRDYMDENEDFTLTKNWESLGTFVNYLHSRSLHVVLNIDTGVQANKEAFQRGLEKKAKFVEWERDDEVQRSIQNLYPLANATKVMLGVGWQNNHVAFPDFSSPSTVEWWRDEMSRFHKKVAFDGVSLSMNEPESFGTNSAKPWYVDVPGHEHLEPLKCPLNGTNSKYDKPPYQTETVTYERVPPSMEYYLSSETLCMIGTTTIGRLYDTKNLYGLQQSIATDKALRNINQKGSLLLTRSSFSSGGRYAGHSVGDNSATFSDLSSSVISIQLFNMFGIPYVGADVCGFHENSTEELCSRWHQLGAFYSFYRNYNDKNTVSQVPTAWESTKMATQRANVFRYHFLPYLFMLHFEASRIGGTVVRPVFFEFPEEDATHISDQEFMWGSALLVIPATERDESFVYGYLPRAARWYSLLEMNHGSEAPKGFSIIEAPIAGGTPVFIRGGSIIPSQEPYFTATQMRKGFFSLTIALDENNEAEGKFVWDNGYGLVEDFDKHNYYELKFHFKMNDTMSYLTISQTRTGNITDMPYIMDLDILGHKKYPVIESVEKKPYSMYVSSYSSFYDASNQELFLHTYYAYEFPQDDNVTITWMNYDAPSSIPQDRRVDCMPKPVTKKRFLHCINLGCLYDDQAPYHVPSCYLPRKSGYVKKSSDNTSAVLESYSSEFNPYGHNISPITFSTSNIGSTVNVRIGSSQRFEPKLDLPRESYDTDEKFVVEQLSVDGIFAFKVKRQSTNSSVWDTSIGGMIFSDQYIQIAAFINSSEFYGLGEHTELHLRHSVTRYTTWAMFARDQDPYYAIPNANLYGAYPFYMAIESDYRTHGVLILNTNAQELTLGPAPHIVYRTIGGMLDMYFFPGPTPEDVIKQYTALVGRPAFPTYWSLGYQLGRLGYESLEEMQKSISSVQEAQIPIDVVHIGVEFADAFQDFTIAKEWNRLPEYVKQLHNQSMHFVITLNPTVEADSDSFKRALDSKANFVEWERYDQVQREIQSLYPLANNTKIMLGNTRPPKHVAFPDFSALETEKWWHDEIESFHKKIEFDGLCLDENEPSNWDNTYTSDSGLTLHLVCPVKGNDSKYDMPPYETENVYIHDNGEYDVSFLAQKTLCMLGETKAGKIYDMKNLYGVYQSIATQKALHAVNSKRSTLLTRSSYPSGAHYAGHWLGKAEARWPHLWSSVITIQEFSLFGFSYVGADVCGNTDTDEEICLRWQQLGAFYTFYRNYNENYRGSIAQHPTVWPSVANATRQANRFRYHYLPYLYTLHYYASTEGSTVIRPLFSEFPDDDAAHENNQQFMWGNAIYVAPILWEELTQCYAYLPRNAIWYSLRDEDYGVKSDVGFIFVSARLDQQLPVFVRGGYIVPRQAPEMTTVASRKNPFELLIAMNEVRKAHGSLFWDDGESLLADNCCNLYNFNFEVNSDETKLSISGHSNLKDIPTLDIIEIFGYDKIPKFDDVKIDGVSRSLVNCAKYDQTKAIVFINCKNLIDMSKSAEHVITWKYSELPSTSTTIKPTSKITTSTTTATTTTIVHTKPISTTTATIKTSRATSPSDITTTTTLLPPSSISTSPATVSGLTTPSNGTTTSTNSTITSTPSTETTTSGATKSIESLMFGTIGTLLLCYFII